MKHVLPVTLALLTAAAHAHVIISEFTENPPGGGSVDETWEFIELQGRPGMSLTGYAIGLLKGGFDSNGDNIPDGPFGDRIPEIDEAYALDGWSIGPNGTFVLYNETTGISFIEPRLTPNPSFNPGQPVGPNNKRYLNGAGFSQLHIPSSDTPGNLANDGSSTYLLVRKRVAHQIVNNQSVYLPGYAFKKDIQHDADFDGRKDFGIEDPVNLPDSDGLASMVDPLQIVDGVAWSNGGGKEYVRSSQQEISDTPGFNPDAVTRIRFYGRNPRAGYRFNSDGELRFTRMADEELVYGELVSIPALDYNNAIDGQGFRQVKGPTDPSGPTYNASGVADPSGDYLFDDISLVGFRLTPGALNNYNATGMGGVNITQFQFVPGDFDFNGAVETEDLYRINANLGASLDDTRLVMDNNETPNDPSDDFTYTGYVFEDRAFQALLIQLEMNMTDGMPGNADTVTASDLAASTTLVRNGETAASTPGR